MRIKVLIPAYFRHLTAEKAEILCAVPTAKANLKHLFDELEKLHPGLKSAVFGSDGRPKRFSGLLINSRPYQNIYAELVDNDIVEVTSVVVQE